MEKISFQKFSHIMQYDLMDKKARSVDPCIEIEFCVDNNSQYQESFLGKMLDEETGKVVYWYGLTSDGTEAYDFLSFDEFIYAKIFEGKCINDIWASISLISIDGGNVHEMLPFYMGYMGKNMSVANN
ncbi:MAG: hypothetical protein FWD05_02485 [Oscillospiraceae bacterium]|nr:hypothetical protein [Oscillospiraceae bacterium]